MSVKLSRFDDPVFRERMAEKMKLAERYRETRGLVRQLRSIASIRPEDARITRILPDMGALIRPVTEADNA